MNLKEKLERIAELEAEVYGYFGPVSGWDVYPLEDDTDMRWMRLGDDKIAWSNMPFTAETIEEGKDLYTGEVRKLFWGDDYVGAVVDTQSESNVLFMIFAKDLQCHDEALIRLCHETW